MVIQHHPGKQHANADPLSQIPDELDYCNCYEAGVELSSLPCEGFKFCTKVHSKWAKFIEDFHDVIPLAVQSASIDVRPEEILSPEFTVNEESIWLSRYTSAELCDAQQADPELKQMFSWLKDK